MEDGLLAGIHTEIKAILFQVKADLTLFSSTLREDVKK